MPQARDHLRSSIAFTLIYFAFFLSGFPDTGDSSNSSGGVCAETTRMTLSVT